MRNAPGRHAVFSAPLMAQAVSIFPFRPALSDLVRSWNPFRFLRRRIDRDPLLSVLPAKLSSIPVSTPAARLQPARVPAASPGRLPPAQDSIRPGVCPGGVGQPEAVARRARRLSEDLLAHASRSR